MSFTPRYTMPDPSSNYYDAWNRFYWMDISPYGGNCTGYAYGRSNEIAGRSLYNEFYITGPDGNAKNWIYNTWPDYTHTSGSIDLQLGDILVWGCGTFGHVEVVEAINGNQITTSYSVWGETYGTSQKFATRTISKPSWGSDLGYWVDNNGTTHYYSNCFIGYIHNKYADVGPTPEPETPRGSFSPSSASSSIDENSDSVTRSFDITILGMPVSAYCTGSFSLDGCTMVSQTGWSYSFYIGEDGNTYGKAEKTITVRYDRESNDAYSTTKTIRYTDSFTTGSVNIPATWNISVAKKKSGAVLFLQWDGAYAQIL